MKKKILLAIFILLIIALGGFAWLYVDFIKYIQRPAGADSIQKIVLINQGDNFKKITSRLNQAGIITHPFKFRLYARLKKYDHRIKAGEYAFSTGMSPAQILAVLVSGRVRLYRLTVPEGLTLDQIASLVADKGLCGTAEFLKLTGSAAFAEKLDIPAACLEGYLFPDTYFFPKNVTAREIITRMHAGFRAVFTQQWKQRAVKMGLSVHQTVTLASIIEKETGAAFERPLISSVFHNRLKKGMRLESDPTVIYGIKNFDGNITRKHLAAKTPYNTYQIKGLPPGPIANPGAEALKAALFPADTKFLFFVARKDRTHQFSTNLKDHRRAVRKYQMKR
ncbi:MAG: aminodeoxychorismate lyase [Desulfobacteraceae bacterium 4572_123]|nr:MAG: aminodeoxychorismate lyase [Desulfobacteraceae bacterium 4572_123]